MQIFQAVCGAELSPVSCESCKECNESEIVLAVISLVGDVECSLFLGLPQATAVEAARRFAGFEVPFDSEDMGDAIGELTNIFAGQVKALLDKREVRADISLPSVVRAKGMKVLVQKGTSNTKCCYECGMGRLWTGVLAGPGAGMMA